MYKTASKNIQRQAEKGRHTGFSEATIKQCRNILEDLAKSGRRITYADLAKRIGIARQSLGDCLKPIRAEEKSAQPPRPDLTTIVHFSNKKYGYVVPKNRAGYRAYKEELRRVYKHWGGNPEGNLKEWFQI